MNTNSDPGSTRSTTGPENGAAVPSTKSGVTKKNIPEANLDGNTLDDGPREEGADGGDPQGNLSKEQQPKQEQETAAVKEENPVAAVPAEAPSRPNQGQHAPAAARAALAATIDVCFGRGGKSMSCCVVL